MRISLYFGCDLDTLLEKRFSYSVGGMSSSVRRVKIVFSLLAMTYYYYVDATLIASSKIIQCGRENINTDPKELDGKRCDRKFVVALTVENGKVRKREKKDIFIINNYFRFCCVWSFFLE